MSKTIDAIVIDARDNVAVALRDLKAGSNVHVAVGPEMTSRFLEQDIPAGHKFALLAIGKDEDVIKYGEKIGKASTPISAGEHVHVHNVASQRGRGDLA